MAISFKKIKHLESNTVRLFCLLAFLASDNVPEYMIPILQTRFFAMRLVPDLNSKIPCTSCYERYHSGLVRYWKSGFRSVSKPRQTTDLLG